MKPTPLPITLAAAAVLSVSAAAFAQTSDAVDDNPQSREKFSQTIATKASTAETTVDKSAVQAKRDEGWGWGAIANFFGFNLGSAVSEANRERRDERLAEVKDRSSVDDSLGRRGRGSDDGVTQASRSGDDGGSNRGGRGSESSGRGGDGGGRGGGDGGGRR